jgi:hypothetical protein
MMMALWLVPRQLSPDRTVDALLGTVTAVMTDCKAKGEGCGVNGGGGDRLKEACLLALGSIARPVIDMYNTPQRKMARPKAAGPDLPRLRAVVLDAIGWCTCLQYCWS